MEHVIIAGLHGDLGHGKISIGKHMGGPVQAVLDQAFYRREAERSLELRTKIGHRHSCKRGHFT